MSCRRSTLYHKKCAVDGDEKSIKNSTHFHHHTVAFFF